MKVIIAGSRSIEDYHYKDLIKMINRSNYDISEIVSGCAIGADRLGEKYANYKSIPIKKMPANWNEYGKVAGHIRNKQMADYADAAIILWDGVSPGTKNMIAHMNKLNKPYQLYLLTDEP